MSILERHKRLRNIGEAILRLKFTNDDDRQADDEWLSDDDRKFVGQALVNIGNGKDARDELQTKPHGGERSFATTRRRHRRDRMAMGWVAAARLPESQGGLGLTLDEAIALLDESETNAFGLDADTIRKYWNNRPEDRDPVFTLED